MKKTQHILSFLLIPAFLLGSFAVIPQAGATKPTPNANFSISSVSPSEFSPSQSTAITINGASFTNNGLKAGIIKSGNEIASAAILTDIAAVFSSTSSMTATVPSGLTAGEYDLYVYDPNQSTFTFAKKEKALEGNVDVDSNIDTLTQSNRNSARRKMDVTFTGVSLQKKNWVKVRMNGKNVPILKIVSRTATSTTLRLNVKYKGWAPGPYDLTMTYKYRQKVQTVTTHKGKTKTKTKNVWKKDNKIVADDIITILPAVQ